MGTISAGVTGPEGFIPSVVEVIELRSKVAENVSSTSPAAISSLIVTARSLSSPFLPNLTSSASARLVRYLAISGLICPGTTGIAGIFVGPTVFMYLVSPP